MIFIAISIALLSLFAYCLLQLRKKHTNQIHAAPGSLLPVHGPAPAPPPPPVNLTANSPQPEWDPLDTQEEDEEARMMNAYLGIEGVEYEF